MKILGILLILLCLAWPAGASYEVGDVVEDFTLTDLYGNPVSLSQFAGNIIVLNFFTTWCPGCNEEALHLENDIWQVYGDQGVVVLAIDVQEPASLVQGWAQALEITYPIWLAPDWELFQLFPQAVALPYNAVLGPDLRIRYASFGFDLTDILDMIVLLQDEGGVPAENPTWDGVKSMYRD